MIRCGVLPARALVAWGLASLAWIAPAAPAEPQSLYQQHCASCHGAGRLGAMGPALLPESLERLAKAEALKVVREGRPATQMPGFGKLLGADEVEQLAAWIYTPVEPRPTWDESQIRASRVVHFKPEQLRDSPVFSADMMNLFIVVEAGDQHVSILDGDKLERIHRFPSRFALHGGPKFTPDGRYVFFASRDGWVSKFDIWNLKTVTEVRAGINTRNLAVSADGKLIAVANYLPHSIVLLDAQLDLIKALEARALEGAKTSRVAAVYDAAPRRSFVAAMKDIAELWEVSYDPGAEPIYDGYVHDYKMREGLAAAGYLNPRRSRLEYPLEDFFFDPSYANVIGAARSGKAQVVNLDVRRKIADLDLPGMPHLGSGITWEWRGTTVMATPNLQQGEVSVIEMKGWKSVKQIPTLGPGFFLRSHENSRYAWVDSMMSPQHKDTLQVIDKVKLETVAELRPAPGKTLAHIEFDRYGKYALASLWESDGAIIVFDAATLQEIKRIPARKPVGKYNLYNKITRSPGTSH